MYESIHIFQKLVHAWNYTHKLTKACSTTCPWDYIQLNSLSLWDSIFRRSGTPRCDLRPGH